MNALAEPTERLNGDARLGLIKCDDLRIDQITKRFQISQPLGAMATLIDGASFVQSDG